LGSYYQRDGDVDSACERLLGFPEYGEITPSLSSHPVTLLLIFGPFIRCHWLVCVSPLQADVSKVIEVRDVEDFTKEAIDAKLSSF